MPHKGGALILSYTINGHGRAPEHIRETVYLDATPCNYGGERSWFLCPGCMSRRDVLFSVNGRFRCRACYDIAYTSTREDAMDRATRRIWRLQERLGYLGGDVWHIPPRPAEQERAQAIDAELVSLHRTVDLLTRGALLAAGFERHKRQWRHRRDDTDRTRQA